MSRSNQFSAKGHQQEQQHTIDNKKSIYRQSTNRSLRMSSRAGQLCIGNAINGLINYPLQVEENTSALSPYLKEWANFFIHFNLKRKLIPCRISCELQVVAQDPTLFSCILGLHWSLDLELPVQHQNTFLSAPCQLQKCLWAPLLVMRILFPSPYESTSLRFCSVETRNSHTIRLESISLRMLRPGTLGTLHLRNGNINT